MSSSVTSESVISRTSPWRNPVCSSSRAARSSPALTLPPCVGMIPVSRAPTNDEIMRVSVVSGVTVNACVEKTTSAV